MMYNGVIVRIKVIIYFEGGGQIFGVDRQFCDRSDRWDAPP